MQQCFDRRSFLLHQGVAVVAIGGMNNLVRGEVQVGAGSERQPASIDGVWPGFPQQDPALVREMVGAAHGRVDRVDELLAAHPALANASYDWGYGDWETALGAASHVGHRVIAEELLQHGARLDLFAAAMLGMLDVVKATLVAQPLLARVRGPHGISLMAHARSGKNDALVKFLEGVDGAESETVVPLTSDAMKPYVGSYTISAGAGTLVVSESRFGLTIKATTTAGGGIDRGLKHLGEHGFHPAGAPNVRVTFTLKDGVATRVEIVESDWLVSATRDG